MTPEIKPIFLTPGFGIVIPAQAGIQRALPMSLDSRLRGNDGGGDAVVALVFHALRVGRSAMGG